MRGRKRGAAIFLILVAAGLLLWSGLRDEGTPAGETDSARIQAAVELHNASFAPSRETLRAWALFDDVRCRLHVAGESPSRVLLAATLDSGSWLLIQIGEDEVDYDSYRQGSGVERLEAASGMEAERLFSAGAPCSVRDEGEVSSP